MKRSTVLWRWRRNPLRDRSYATEGWALLALSTAGLVGATVTGLAVARGDEARYVQQRHDRHPTAAVLTENATALATDVAQPETRVRWTVPGGAAHSGPARVDAGLKSGDRTTIWLDGHGRPVPKPLSAADGLLQAALTGTAAGSGIGAAALLGGTLTAASFGRRRIGRWETEWAQVGPQWNHRDA